MSQRGWQENLRGRYIVKIFTSVFILTQTMKFPGILITWTFVLQIDIRKIIERLPLKFREQLVRIFTSH